MLKMWQDALSVGALLLITCLVRLLYKWRNPSCSNGMLPPGSMGLPLLGETLQFFAPNTTSEVSPFVRRRVKRYGPIFKTNLVGRPVVVSTDPQFNQFVFQQEGKLFQSWYPVTFTEIFGRQNIGVMQGTMFKFLKGFILREFGPENLRQNLFHEAADAIRSGLASWPARPSIELKDATATMIFNLTAKKLISFNASEATEDLKENFVAFMDGLISFPINVRGTSYRKCMQGRKKAMGVLKGILLERRRESSEKRLGNRDFFDLVLEELGKENTLLTEAVALDLMLVMLFASYETVSLTMTMAVKLLTDHPAVLHQLAEENDAIINKRENPTSWRLTWEEYKSMPFTSQVINETVRLANIVPAIFRKTLEDVHIKGYTIPTGWAVMVCPPSIHLNPDIYEDPLSFNPWRWKGVSESGGMHRNFMAFGGGMRFCIGVDFAKMALSIFLHYLVTNYRWKAIKGGNTIRTPSLTFPDGFHVQFFKRK